IASKHPTPEQRPRFTQVTTFDEGDTVQRVLAERGQILPTHALKDAEWTLANQEMGNLLDKLKNSGTPLRKYINGKFYAGIKSGYNEAFLIDDEKRRELIKEDPNSEQLIKPYLRGRDIKRWNVLYNYQEYIIFVPRGTNINNYPSIYNHLMEYKDNLLKKAGGNQWYELASASHHSDFSKPKIVYPDIAKSSYFAVDSNGLYVDMTAFFIPTSELYLLGILNSLVSRYFIIYISSTLRGNFVRLKSQYVSQIPIPNASEGLRGRIATLAQQCLDATAKGAPVAPLEAELNALVYEAYGLTADEIAIIESGTGSSSQPTHPSDEEL
ncbi:MAG: TaqI-like C-terminal specificity domain-containing protein, partial [Phototrophicaceae bacterium]